MLILVRCSILLGAVIWGLWASGEPRLINQITIKYDQAVIEVVTPQQADSLCVPTEGSITQRYSSSHPGIDISSVSGQIKGARVTACAGGTVVYVGVAELSQDNPNNIKHAVAIKHDEQINGKYI